MSKFMSGKWKYDELFGTIYHDETNKTLAIVSDARIGRCFCPTAEGQSNARLIASAPEMYKLLNALVHREYDNTVTTVLMSKAQELLASIDGEEADQ